MLRYGSDKWKIRLLDVVCSASIVCMLLFAMVVFTACNHVVGVTTVQIVDSVRHYFPVIMGQDMRIKLEIRNTGTEPLIIDDIQPSWGVFVSDVNSSKGNNGDFGIIPVGKKQVFYLNYRTELNSGPVEHIIRVYGNIAPEGIAYLKFDVNLVPPTTSSVDYEGNHYEEMKHIENIKGVVDGVREDRQYYVGSYVD